MRVIADITVCQGHQLCQGEAPDIFGFDSDGDHVVILVDQPDESRRAEVATAVRYCPAFALSIEED
jgi:ferredoxin